ncbi:hemolysin family protein [Candidatus Synechococcus calcipolaris G9]|uniref:Hemolysin family protein n=1 Tax=Candidatus Synechococcus calcipolaris G9 TaxID=1497997 RepID=A0ABT6F0R4_9SYNE|nr:hemolysin family protein [Candidatus Synechococcus calcipolaris]MDG2991446.1 hemolysin family protein [Candidatus Synechococcus calcipolaris G9]
MIPILGILGQTTVVSRLVAVIILVLINAFFVAAEFSVVAMRRSRVEQLVSAGDVGAKKVYILQQRIDRLLSTTQLGITLSSLGLGWIGESTMASVLSQEILRFPLPESQRYWLSHSLAAPLAFAMIAYFQIVLGELFPKAIALRHPEQLARVLGPISLIIARVVKPIIWLLNQSTYGLLGLLKISYDGQLWSHQVTPEELQLIIASKESSGLEEEERELLRNVFEFGDVLVEEVMIPRTQIDALSDTSNLQDVLDAVAEHGHSYYPIIRDSLDDVRGILAFKDLAQPLADGELTGDRPISDWVKPAWFIPEGTPLGEVLPMMQKYRLSMIMVREAESSGTAGLVTLQDVINEIIGEEDNHPAQAAPIRRLEVGTYLIQAQTHLEEVNETLKLMLPVTDDYQTLAGFLLYQWQKVPELGETLVFNDLKFTVISRDGPRLDQVQLQWPDEVSTEINASSVTSVEIPKQL